MSPSDYTDNGFERLATACEDPDVVYAFDRAGDNDSYPGWAVGSLDTYDAHVRGLVQKGLPDQIAAERAALVFGLTAPNTTYMELAKSLSISQDVLEAAADQALISHVAEYAHHQVQKDGDWDESKVARDELGQFAPEGDQAPQFRVINGRKYKVSVQTKVQRQVDKPEERVAAVNTDEQILAAAEAQARKDRRNKRKKRASRAGAQHAQLQQLEQQKRAAEAAAKREAAVKRSTAGAGSVKSQYLGRKKLVASNKAQAQTQSAAGGGGDSSWLDPFKTLFPRFGSLSAGQVRRINMGFGTVIPDTQGPDIKGLSSKTSILAEESNSDYKPPLVANQMITNSIDRVSSLYTNLLNAGHLQDSQDIANEAMRMIQWNAMDEMERKGGPQRFEKSLIMVRGLREEDDGKYRQARFFVTYKDLVNGMGKIDFMNGGALYGTNGDPGIKVEGYDEVSPGVWSDDVVSLSISKKPSRSALYVKAGREDDDEISASWDESEHNRDEIGQFAPKDFEVINGRKYKVKQRSPEFQVLVEESKEDVRANVRRRREQRARRARGHAIALQAAPRSSSTSTDAVGRTSTTAGNSTFIGRRVSSSSTTNTITSTNTDRDTDNKVAVQPKIKTSERVEVLVAAKTNPQAQQQSKPSEPPKANAVKISEHPSPVVENLLQKLGTLTGSTLLIGPGGLDNLGRGMAPIGVEGARRSVYMTPASWEELKDLEEFQLPIKYEIYGEGTAESPLELGSGIEPTTQESKRALARVVDVYKSADLPRIRVTTLGTGGVRWIKRGLPG